MRLSAIFAALVLGLSSATADAQTMRVENGARFGGWTVACEAIAVNETLCVLSQRLVRTDSGAVLAELIAFNSEDEVGSYIAARVPNGVFFPSGFVISPQESDSQLEFIWQTCSPEICEALLSVSADQLDLIAANDDWIAGYRPDMVSDPLVFRVSLGGLEDGLSALAGALGQTGPREVSSAETEQGQ